MSLATKYQFTEIRDGIVSLFESDWPRTRVEWLAFKRARRPEDGLQDYCPRQTTLLLEPASAIRFAEKHGVRSVLPAAYYQLSQTSIEHYWDCCCLDHAVDAQIPTLAISHVLGARWECLDAADHRILAHGRLKVARAKRSIYAEFIDLLELSRGRFETCSCERELEDFLDHLSRGIDDADTATGHPFSSEIFGAFAEFEDYDKLEQRGFCMEAKRFIEECSRNLTDGLWDKLPDYFKLPQGGFVCVLTAAIAAYVSSQSIRVTASSRQIVKSRFLENTHWGLFDSHIREMLSPVCHGTYFQSCFSYGTLPDFNGHDFYFNPFRD